MITCYICGTVAKERTMAKLTTGDVELWWCRDASWCRSRWAADKLESEGLLQVRSLADRVAESIGTRDGISSSTWAKPEPWPEETSTA